VYQVSRHAYLASKEEVKTKDQPQRKLFAQMAMSSRQVLVPSYAEQLSYEVPVLNQPWLDNGPVSVGNESIFPKQHLLWQ
jgi:hypothetical protein